MQIIIQMEANISLAARQHQMLQLGIEMKFRVTPTVLLYFPDPFTSVLH
ncbi:hypothetical protein X975_14854, partial [Stegodyphus mimosarum]